MVSGATLVRCMHVTQLYSIETVCWVVENLHPFDIVKDCAFQCLMMTEQSEYYLLHPGTVFQDVKVVFVYTHNHVAKMLQVSISIG